MRLYNRITKLIIVSLSLIVIASCDNDLEETVYDKISAKNLTYSDEEIESIAGNVYKQLRYACRGWDNWMDIQLECSDLMMIPLRIGVGWGDYYISMHKHEFNATMSHNYSVWFETYPGITYANSILDLVSEEKNPQKRAEIRALRALLYYMLFDLFRNVPLVTTTEYPEGYLPEQADPRETFNFIVSELKDAKEDLGTEKVFGQMNRYVADMVLAKMYLNHNAWFNDHSSTAYYDSAIMVVDDVLDNGGYTLASAYSDNFREDISGSPEIIFAVPLDATYAGHYYLAPRSLLGAGAAAFGYDGGAWNGSCAIPQFMDTYHANDKRFDDTWAHGQQYDYDTGDPIRTAVDDQGEVNLAYTKEVHSIDNPGAYMLEGYRYKKNEIVAGTDGTAGSDVPYFRLADAMFIKAECLLRLGRNQDEAASLITQVRQRAFDDINEATRSVADLTGPSAYDYGHREYTNEGPTVYDPDAFVATYEGGDDIELGGLLDDLAWEFVGEHHRRQDLIRFRLSNGSNVFNGKSWFCKDAVSDPNDLHKNIFPIHQEFLSGNKNLVQNPGYIE